MQSTDGVKEGEEIASLCVGKLRGMIIVEGDPNRELTSTCTNQETNNTVVKYVALLAFNKIVLSHPHLISMQQDVIMGCIDDPDISIRLQALDLSAGLVNNDNIAALVERLMRQLRIAPVAIKGHDEGRSHALGLEPTADSDGEDPEETLRPTAGSQEETFALPAEYRATVIHRILDMCSRDTYTNISDFEWYIDILIQLVKLVPTADGSVLELCESGGRSLENSSTSRDADVSDSIGRELRNVAVRVSTVRSEAVKAAKSLLSISNNEGAFALNGAEGVLPFVAWIVGEYVDTSVSSFHSLDSLIHPKIQLFSPIVVCAYLQAIPKVLTSIVSQTLPDWSSEHKTMISLLVARVIHFLEPLAMHPSLEIQERSVELLELMRVTLQAIASHGSDNDHGPLILTRAMPQLFTGFELNAVAPTAQRKVPLPNNLDLGIPINKTLSRLLQLVEQDPQAGPEIADFNYFYNKRPDPRSAVSPAFDALPSCGPRPSYQQTGASILNTEALKQKRNERRERNKDDPFYIGNDEISSGTSTPFHDILRSTNGESVDIDSIPIMNLDLGDKSLPDNTSDTDPRRQKPKRARKFKIAKDENIEQEVSEGAQFKASTTGAMDGKRRLQQASDKSKRSLLQVDSSRLSSLSLDASENPAEQFDFDRQEAQDAEMTRALAEVERLRLEMQRASERIQAIDGTPAEGAMVKKKKKKKKLRLKQPAEDIGTENDDLNLGRDGDTIRDSKNAEACSTVKRKKGKKVSVVKPGNEMS